MIYSNIINAASFSSASTMASHCVEEMGGKIITEKEQAEAIE